MDDGSTVSVSGLEAADLAVTPTAAALALTTTGYCAGCGTWDSHGLACATCGYDFTGTPSAVPQA